MRLGHAVTFKPVLNRNKYDFRMQQNTLKYTEEMMVSPHRGIVFGTSDNTIATSADLSILSGWKSPLATENPLSPSLANVRTGKNTPNTNNNTVNLARVKANMDVC